MDPEPIPLAPQSKKSRVLPIVIAGIVLVIAVLAALWYFGPLRTFATGVQAFVKTGEVNLARVVSGKPLLAAAFTSTPYPTDCDIAGSPGQNLTFNVELSSLADQTYTGYHADYAVYDINWGNGTNSYYGYPGTYSMNTTHSWDTPGTYTVQVNMTSSHSPSPGDNPLGFYFTTANGNQTKGRITYDEVNDPLTCKVVILPPGGCTINTTVGTSVPFKLHTQSSDAFYGQYIINYGDGSQTQTASASIPATSEYSTSHTWTTPGTYEVDGRVYYPSDPLHSPFDYWSYYLEGDGQRSETLDSRSNTTPNPSKCFVTVTAPTTAPDLTAGSVTPATATTGIAVTLQSVITNVGTGGTGAGFTNLFQAATNASGAGAADLGTHTAPALVANGTVTATLTHTFSTAGDYYIRACADKSSASDTGDITESSETNNCSAGWTKVTVSTISAGPDLTASAVTPTVATAGTSVTLSSIVKNQGDATTSAGFTNLFQVATNSTGTTGLAALGTHSFASSLAKDATRTTSLAHTFASAGDYYVRVCADKSSASDTGDITESDEGNNCGAWTKVVVSPVTTSGPDLKASSVTPTSANAGTSITLNSIIQNDGDADTGAGFTNLFQVASDSTGTGAAALGTHSFASSLLDGAARTTSLSHTFATAGDYYVRVCADKSSAGDTGDITESDEGNNCGSWTDVTIYTPPPPPPSGCTGPASLSLKPNKSLVNSGGTTTITWSASNTNSACTLTDSHGKTVDGSTAGKCTDTESGTDVSTGPINTQTVYTLTCGADSMKVTVNVAPKYFNF